MSENSLTGLEIAVIGMAGRFPGAKNIAEFWENIKSGVRTVTTFSEDELRAAGIDAALIENPDYVKVKGLMEEAEAFDAEFFGYSDKEAEIMDPQIRVLTECAYEALEDAGYNAEQYNGFIGFYAGALPNHYWEEHVAEKSIEFGEQFDALHLIDKDFLSSRISHKLKLKGPSICLMTACSSSLTSIHLACRSLLTGECGMALAGGVNIMFPLISGYLYKEGTILSPDGHCRPFDAKAVGTCGGDGAGIVVLKLLEEAIEAKDHIYAVIKGSAIYNDGAREVGYTASSVEGISDTVKLALGFSKVEPESISYIETHGVGTPLGDALEIEGLKRAFATDIKNTCAIGSLKPNIGYLGLASGIAGLIKTVLSIKHSLIPPTLNYEVQSPLINFEDSPFYVNTRLCEWKNEKHPLRAGVSSFGVGGTHAHIVLEEAPMAELRQINSQWNVIPLSAQNERALEAASANLSEFLKNNSEINIEDVAYTLQEGRKEFKYRRMTVCKNAREAAENLEQLRPDLTKTIAAQYGDYPCILIFGNNATHIENIGKGLYESSCVFKTELDICFKYALSLTDCDFMDILFNRASQRNVRKEILHTYVFCIEYATAKLIMSYGITPKAVVGYGVGEYTAACLAGVISFEDAIKLLAIRGKIIDELPLKKLLRVYSSEKELSKLLDENIALAAVSSMQAAIVCGTEKAIFEFERKIEELGFDCRSISDVEYYNNSELTASGLDKFKDALEQISLKSPEIPYLSSVSGRWVEPMELTVPRYWLEHFTLTMRFLNAAEELLKEEKAIFIEIGYGKEISNILKQHENKNNSQFVYSILKAHREDLEDMNYFLKIVGELWCMGVKIDWNKAYENDKRCRVSIPTYPFQRKYFRG